MKFTLVVFVAACGCLASSSEVVQKRSISDNGWLGASYGLSSAALVAPSISTISLGAPTISSHTHTHSTAVIDRPYPVAVKTPIISSASYIPSASYLPSSPLLSSYNYGLGSFGSYPSYSYGSSLGSYGGSYYPSFNKYYSRSYPTVYKKSIYSYPSLKYSKW
jgi:hypothetical protein